MIVTVKHNYREILYLRGYLVNWSIVIGQEAGSEAGNEGLQNREAGTGYAHIELNGGPVAR
ncbi:hypothetical protein I7I51_00508 [Histoplasma capsulatum]|uniref:Uncharacterized protein n=1 Tax=Ajellomyces capsulatus TaxID=5037 RepID=A0A8A1ME49_AJECA|nr:predicted protein [Histoplasma mississippiense (nom. inval.)]EDN08852.1 predicted protein [Histoplasma mississippiense (nom. inval.)]QSS63450.1 hypothetical protein I7I51_00508 [Histoplasma capsulatum]